MLKRVNAFYAESVYHVILYNTNLKEIDMDSLSIGVMNASYEVISKFTITKIKKIALIHVGYLSELSGYCTRSMMNSSDPVISHTFYIVKKKTSKVVETCSTLRIKLLLEKCISKSLSAACFYDIESPSICLN